MKWKIPILLLKTPLSLMLLASLSNMYCSDRETLSVLYFRVFVCTLRCKAFKSCMISEKFSVIQITGGRTSMLIFFHFFLCKIAQTLYQPSSLLFIIVYYMTLTIHHIHNIQKRKQPICPVVGIFFGKLTSSQIKTGDLLLIMFAQS